ncbi:MAG: BamA/TamA family outer membrane protein, partial [Sphingomicrobium sp.]
MSGRISTRLAARLLGAAFATVVSSSAAAQAVPLAASPAQPTPDPANVDQGDLDAANLDPGAPLAALPDIGVAWPELDARRTAPASAQGVDPLKDGQLKDGQLKDGPGVSRGDVRYTFTLKGLDTLPQAAELQSQFRAHSALEADRKKPANAAQVVRRAKADSDLLVELLRSQGYYDASVEPALVQGTATLDVELTANAGVQYQFGSVNLPGLEAAGADQAKLRDAFAVKAGDPVIAQQVIAGGAALKTALGELGFPQAKLGEQDVEVDHRTHIATLTLPVAPGPVAQFGAIRVTGHPPFSARHLEVIARFRRGDRFERSKVDDLRRALIATSLVANAEITVVPVDGGRTVDLAVALDPAPSHTIAGELGYGTGQGVRAEATWTDRNFFNPEGALTLRGVLGTSEQLAAVQVRRSNFVMRDQTINLQFAASHEKYDAYEARTVRLLAYIERQSNFIWQKTWTWSYGAEFLGTDENGVFSDSGLKDTRRFLIAALPLSLGYDGSDDLLDPSRGFRLSGRLSPELSAHGGHFTYARTQIDASAYYPVTERIVAAGRIRLGTILGAGVYDIAPSRRFYSGGGGSVRGYGYQQLGPKAVDGSPIGGRGLAEFAIEARIRLSQFGGNFGIVPFFDGGSLNTGQRPDFGGWRFAAGLGLRYYSSFGPIRIDFGVPLNR